VIDRQKVQPEAPLDGAQEADPALCPVARGGHQPDGIIVGGEFLSLRPAQAEDAAR
jgi:hypothetical protein